MLSEYIEYVVWQSVVHVYCLHMRTRNHKIKEGVGIIYTIGEGLLLGRGVK